MCSRPVHVTDVSPPPHPSLVAQFGGAPCAVSSIASTSIVCVTSPHPNGTVDVSVMVGGEGRASGDLHYSYMLQVASISHCSG